MPTAQKKPQSEYDIVHCTPAQIKELKDDIKETEKMLMTDQRSRNPKISSPGDVIKELKKKKAVVENHAPKPFKSVHEENKANAVVKQLAKFIQKHMPSNREYYQMYPKQKDKHGNPMTPDHRQKSDFDRVVKQQIFFQTDPKVKLAVQRYKHLMRRLDPNDPSITDIERLRR